MPGINPVTAPEQRCAGFQRAIGSIGGGPVIGDVDRRVRRDACFGTPAGAFRLAGLVPANDGMVWLVHGRHCRPYATPQKNHGSITKFGKYSTVTKPTKPENIANDRHFDHGTRAKGKR